MDTSSISTICEVLMLVCFAFSWPISIIKALKTKIVAGKSPLFMIVIITGYLMGIIHKILSGFDWVTYLYMFNTLIVSTDLFLYFYYTSKNKVS